MAFLYHAATQDKESSATGPVVLDPSTLGLVVRLGTSSCSWFPLLPGHRYAIDRSTDAERIFDIDAKTGAIVTGKVLDRETAGWHNITVLAMEAGEMQGCSVGQEEESGCCHCRVAKTRVLINTEVKKKNKCSSTESDISLDNLKILFLS